MTFKKWAWDVFESTGNLEAFLAMKEAELQEMKESFGKMEIADLENIEKTNKKFNTINIDKMQNNGDINGVNKN